MDKLKLSGLVILILFAVCTSSIGGNTDHVAAGNLESAVPAECLLIEQLSSDQDPVDIFTGINICLNKNDYTGAANLYFAGMSYGYYDTKRVSDKTAHQAISVLRRYVLSSQSEETINSLQIEIDKIKKNNTQLCSNLTKLGKPTYEPTYMIQHGMSAFTGQSTKDGLVENFDSQQAWKDSISKIAKCV